MRLAYADTSYLVAIAFGERGAGRMEAEFRSALAQEGVGQFDRILAIGYLRGADLWHLAIALFLSPDGRGLTFLSLDERQRKLADRLGFGL